MFVVILVIVTLLVLMILVLQSGNFWWGIGAGVGAGVGTKILAVLAEKKLDLQSHWIVPPVVGLIAMLLVWGLGVAEELGL